MPTTPLLPGGLARTRHLALSISLSLLLAACNSDSGDSASTPSATELPFSVEVQGPAANNALGTAVAFSANVADPSNKLKYQWQFGDGETSAAANPSHTYATAGVYRVQLLVTNEVGATRVSSAEVSVSDARITSGKLCSGDNNTGWCWQKPLPQGNAINDYFFVDDKRGWMVGDLGTVLTTSDGGTSWQRQASGTELPLTTVHFVNAQIGWIVAANGIVFKTSDGGASWSAASNRLSANATLFGASDATTAWFADQGWIGVLATRDGGVHWSRIVANGRNISRYVPASASTIWATGYSGSELGVLRTVDGGATWADIAVPPITAGLSRSIDDLKVADSNHAWLIGAESGWQNNDFISRRFAYRTVDGGATWQPFNTPSDGLRELTFVDANNGFALSAQNNVLLSSADGGMTWRQYPLSMLANSYISKFKVLSKSLLLIKDWSGKVFQSVDGGISWRDNLADTGYQSDVTGIWFFNAQEGLAIRSDGSASRTVDGGQSWVTQVSQNQSSSWRRLQFFASGSGWAISDAGTIYRSTDKGKTWSSPVLQSSASMYGVTDFHFIDEKNGWAVTGSPSNAQASIFQSVDGGLSWQAVANTGDISGLNAIRFSDRLHGIAVGNQGLAYVTVDGGVTWTQRVMNSYFNMMGVTFVDAKTVIAVGESGAVLRSTDSGMTWNKVPRVTASNLNGVRFVSSKIGWAVGTNGVVISTKDGGLSWAVQSSGAVADFLSAFFLNEQTGWIVGSNGTIMATTTGGR